MWSRGRLHHSLAAVQVPRCRRWVIAFRPSRAVPLWPSTTRHVTAVTVCRANGSNARKVR